jgi:uncharacterized protein
MRLKTLLFSLCVLFGWNAAVAAIDCGRAKTNIDKLICSSSRLTVAENMMAFSYREAMRRGVDPYDLRRTQQQWRQKVRDACNDVPCLMKAFDERGAELDNY